MAHVDASGTGEAIKLETSKASCPGDAKLTEDLRKNQGAVFAEDEVVLELQQRNLLRNPGRRLVNLDIDRGGSQVRRILARLSQAEEVSEPSSLRPAQKTGTPGR